MLQRELEKTMYQKLLTSCIPKSKETIKSLGLEAVRAKAVDGYGTNFEKRGGIRIPYFNFAGEELDFFRIRYLEEPEKKREKSPKYMQPAGVTPKFYLTPTIDWVSVADDVETDILITEGEFKAICGCLNDMATIGLGGVYSWKSKKKKIPSILDFEDFKWKDRNVYLVFDADLKTNYMVQKALYDLAKNLMRMGAVPKLSFVEDIPEAPKTGMDDYIFHRGIEAFEDRILGKAATYSMMGELVSLNSEVAYVKNPGFVVRMHDGYIMKPSDFTTHQYSNRHYWEERFNKNGEPLAPTKKPAAKGWLDWEARYELEEVTYRPGDPKITADKKFNSWNGWGVEPSKGDVKPWHSLLDYIFKKETEARKWFESWCAIQFQKPGIKLYTACLFWGTMQGTGKSLVGVTLGKIFGENFTQLDTGLLGSQFNEWQQNKQFILGDEVTGTDNRRDADKIKLLITQPTVRVNAKHHKSYDIPDTINYLFTSNHPDAFFLEDSDRRMFVMKMPRVPLDNSFYSNYDKWLHKENGAAALYDYFLNFDIGSFHAKERAFTTSAKRDMVVTTKGELARWIWDMLRDPDDLLWKGGMQMLHGDLFTQEQLLDCYSSDFTRNVKNQGMGKALRAAGVEMAYEGKAFRSNVGTVTLFIIRNREKWLEATLDEVRKHWNDSCEKNLYKPKSR